jgi:hypothetical protein
MTEQNEPSWEVQLLDSVIRMIESRKMMSYNGIIHELHLALASLEAGKLIQKFFFVTRLCIHSPNQRR